MPSHGVRRGTDAHPVEFSVGRLLNLLQGDRLENTTVFSLVPEERLPRMLELVRTHLT